MKRRGSERNGVVCFKVLSNYFPRERERERQRERERENHENPRSDSFRIGI
jgi:hypothetical protein